MEVAAIVGFSLFAAAIIAAVAYGFISQHLRWRARPTMEQYVAEHPGCKTSNGVKCATCGSGSIKNWGVSSPNDTRRLFICNHCGQNLYRSV